MKNTYKHCLSLANISKNYGKPLVGLALSLGSNTSARTPVECSESPYHLHHYSMQNKLLSAISSDLTQFDYSKDNGACNKAFKLSSFQETLLRLHYSTLCEEQKSSGVAKLMSDFTPLHKPHSHCLSNRGYVQKSNNSIKRNLPIEIGYYYSYVNVGIYGAGQKHSWSLPLDVVRVGINNDKLTVAQGQLNGLLGSDSFGLSSCSLVVHTADSGYTQPHYIAPLLEKHGSKLLLINRLRSGMKVYLPYKGPQNPRGKNKCYADNPFHLHNDEVRTYYNPKNKGCGQVAQNPIFRHPTSEQLIVQATTARGREMIVYLYRWNDMLISGTNTHIMHDKPFDLIAIRCIDKKTGEPIFKNDQYIGLWGEQRTSYDTVAAFKDYRHRYDIEVHNRFSKQQLLLDKYQTPDIHRQDAWAWVVAISYWLLFVASKEAKANPKKWEQYLPKIKEILEKRNQEPLSAAMTRKGAFNLFSNFDLKPFSPKVRINGKGRKEGTKMVARPKQKPQKKAVKAAEKQNSS